MYPLEVSFTFRMPLSVLPRLGVLSLSNLLCGGAFRIRTGVQETDLPLLALLVDGFSAFPPHRRSVSSLSRFLLLIRKTEPADGSLQAPASEPGRVPIEGWGHRSPPLA